MTSANLALVRRVWDAWTRGDFRSQDWAHLDIEFTIADGPAPGTWRSLAGMAEGWRGFVDAWSDYRSEAEEYRELTDDRVLVLGSHIGRGRSTGVAAEELRAKGASLFEIRDRKVTRLVLHMDYRRALAELDL
jgi:hypothetical protein